MCSPFLWPKLDTVEQRRVIARQSNGFKMATRHEMNSPSTQKPGPLLVEHQRLPTSGARALQVFTLDGVMRLAIPQLAVDIPNSPAAMNGGDSDTTLLLYRWAAGNFVADGELPVPGGEDASFFKIGSAEFLATASIRTGAGPYELNCESTIFRREQGKWVRFQSIPTFAAKKWHFLSFGDRYFLALAQGVVHEGLIARHPSRSCIYEWDGQHFVEFQGLDGPWGYNWHAFEQDGQHFLAYADHVSPSILLRWNGTAFTPFQEFAPRGGRAFKLFRADGETFLAFANLQGESLLYRWEHGSFTPHQSLSGPGGREFALVQTRGGLYLIQVNFIHGTPAAPKTDLTSYIFRWQDGKLVKVEEFATFGATDATAFSADGGMYVAVSNSLSRDIRFREHTVIYRFTG
jgi:EPTP domain